MSFLVGPKTFKITEDWHLDVGDSDTEITDTDTSIYDSAEYTTHPTNCSLSKSFSTLSCIDHQRDVECESSSSDDGISSSSCTQMSSDSGYEADAGQNQVPRRRHSFGPITLRPLNLDKINQRSLSLSSPNENISIIKALKIKGKAPIKEINLNLKDKEPITGETYYKLMQNCFKNGKPFDVAVAMPDKRTAHVFDAANLKWNSEDTINPITGRKIEKIWWFSIYGNFQNFIYNGNSNERTQKIGSRINKNSPRSKHVKSLPLRNGENYNLDLGDVEPLTGRSYRNLMTEHFKTPTESYSIAVVTEKGKRWVLDAHTLSGNNENPQTGNPIKNICWLSIKRDSEDFNYIAASIPSKNTKTLEFTNNDRLYFRLEQKEPITGSTYLQLMRARSFLTLAVVFEEIPYIFSSPDLGKWDRDTEMRNPVTGNVIEKIWWFECKGESEKFKFMASSEDTSEAIASGSNQQSPRSGSFIQKIGSQIKMSPRKDVKHLF